MRIGKAPYGRRLMVCRLLIFCPLDAGSAVAIFSRGRVREVLYDVNMRAFRPSRFANPAPQKSLAIADLVF